MIKVISTAGMSFNECLEALEEIQFLGQLNSQFIVKYVDSFIEDSGIHIVMEYCEHGDLFKNLAKRNGFLLSENRIWKFFIQIALGVLYLH